MLGAMGNALDHSLYTARLRLEPVTPALAQAARAGQAAFADVLGADAPAEWCASSLQLLARSIPETWTRASPTRAVAIHRAEGMVIGDVRFEPSREFEIGYSIARSRRRQGYAVEATGAVIDWLFEDGGAESILAGCDSRNLASVRTLRRLGFWLDSNPAQTFWWVLTPDLRASPHA
jgi:ribosomal-protein-alanine N-acetyltransferase